MMGKYKEHEGLDQAKVESTTTHHLEHKGINYSKNIYSMPISSDG